VSVEIVPLQHVRVLVHSAIEGVVGSPERGKSAPLGWYCLPCAELAPLTFKEMEEFYRTATPDRAEEIGQMLMDENVVAYGHAFPDRPWTKYPLWARLAYSHEAYDFRLTPVECLKAIEGYTYQASDHLGWCESEACLFLEALRDECISRLAGYEAAEWIYDADLVAAKTERVHNTRRPSLRDRILK
jgi:hypothetical protein